MCLCEEILYFICNYKILLYYLNIKTKGINKNDDF